MAYAFVDTTQAGDSTGQMSIQTIFNKINLDTELTDENGEFTTLTVSGRRNTSNRINTMGITGMHGEYEHDYHTVEPREPTVKFRIRDNTNEGFAERLTRLNSLLRGVKQTLTFADEPMTYYATVAEIDIPEEESNDLIGTITFFCSDPFKYGAEEGYVLSDATTIVNKGSVESEPIIELTALKKTTFAMVTNEADSYNLIGEPADVDEKIVDTHTRLLFERGQTLDTWIPTGTKVDGIVDGRLGTDNDGITVPSYGKDTTTKWHGPALMKEVTPVQDFEVTAMVQGRTTEIDQTYRIEFYLFDENMNELGKMAMTDRNNNINQKNAEARFGKYKGTQVNYPISSRNYQYKWEFFYGMLRFRRIGNKFEFYVTRINNSNKHVSSLKKTYIDADNKLSGKLKYVQIHIGKYADTPRAYAPKINNIEVKEIKKVKVDETPYILDAGDTVEFDHVNDDILINGEARNELKDFGGEFFKLDKGINNIFISPENSFDGTIRFRPKYL